MQVVSLKPPATLQHLKVRGANGYRSVVITLLSLWPLRPWANHAYVCYFNASETYCLLHSVSERSVHAESVMYLWFKKI